MPLISIADFFVEPFGDHLQGETRLVKRLSVFFRLRGMEWDRQAFCRGWFISGATGSGKTMSGLRQLLFQVFTNQPHFGGFFIDDKGTLHETIQEMAAHFGRADDLILLRLRAEDAGTDWTPPHRFNLIGDRSIPTATHARGIVDTATASGQRREQSFFKAAAQIHLAQAQAALAALDYEVTLEFLAPGIHFGPRYFAAHLDEGNDLRSGEVVVRLVQDFQREYSSVVPLLASLNVPGELPRPTAIGGTSPKAAPASG